MCPPVSHQADSFFHGQGVPLLVLIVFNAMMASKMVDWQPWRPLTRENEVEQCRSQFLRIARKTKKGRSVQHGSQRPLKMTQWAPD